MSFVSAPFLLLCLSTLLFYHLAAPSFRVQNFVLLVSSWICYGWANPIWLMLLLAVTLFNYGIGLLLERRSGRDQRWLLILGVAGNLSVLFIYKYFDFFTADVAELLEFVGIKANPVACASIRSRAGKVKFPELWPPKISA
jgi:D-alanyl-lipoteichoic acid acyltransferase DltB (MBOAT superfamily)